MKTVFFTLLAILSIQVAHANTLTAPIEALNLEEQTLTIQSQTYVLASHIKVQDVDKRHLGLSHLAVGQTVQIEVMPYLKGQSYRQDMQAPTITVITIMPSSVSQDKAH